MSHGEAAVDVAYEAGRRSWPAVNLDRAGLAAHLRALNVPADAIARHGADLYLAAACTQGDPAALGHFEASLLPVAVESLGRLRVTADVLDEVVQMTRIRLLVGPAPKIALYTGGGPLAAWVRVAAMRVGLNLLETLKRPLQNPVLPEALDRFLAREGGPEVEATRLLDQGTFQAAVERSLERLSARDKTLLRLHFLDNLSIDAIGLLYRVHRATAARWLVTIRNHIFADLRRDLAIQLRAGSSDLRSLVSLFGGELRLSFDRLLPVRPNKTA